MNNENTTGTLDDDDGRDDEHANENEAPIRETSQTTETPEELEIDDEDSLGHSEDDDADEVDDEIDDEDDLEDDEEDGAS